ncbi:MAG TPA: hypothetical protein VHZ95_08270 [Polyangiales bacterium]|nr:hypothetical protein [Polyangiales bacterium]
MGLWLATWLFGCGASATELRIDADVQRGAYDAASRTYQSEGHERSTLRAFSEAILRTDAEQADPARQRLAFSELSLLGNRARPLLDAIAKRERSDVRADAIRARALAQLSALGDGAARSKLRALADDPDPEVADLAYSALDREHDAQRLREALASPRPARRLAAVRSRKPEGDQRSDRDLAELSEISRVDPQPSVRAAALFALEPYGASALPAFERAVRDDSDESVRISAIEAFARALPDRAEALLDQKLGGSTSAESLAAALALLRIKSSQRTRALDAIANGLTSGDPSLRARTALLLRTVPESDRDLQALRAQLDVERIDEVKLALALTLGTDDPLARATLRTLARGPTLTAAEAAYELARLGDADSFAKLAALRTSPASTTRTSVARLLGRGLAQPNAVTDLLSDREASVRDAAAGAILATLL